MQALLTRDARKPVSPQTPSPGSPASPPRSARPLLPARPTPPSPALTAVALGGLFQLPPLGLWFHCCCSAQLCQLTPSLLSSEVSPPAAVHTHTHTHTHTCDLSAHPLSAATLRLFLPPSPMPSADQPHSSFGGAPLKTTPLLPSVSQFPSERPPVPAGALGTERLPNSYPLQQGLALPPSPI